ncbi:MAG: FtsX-like permease family protein [Pseudomonadota bacterium]
MNRAALHALLSHWWRNPLQMLTLLGGLALATALWSGVQAVNAEARASYDAAAATIDEAQFDQLVMKDGGPIDQAIYVALRRGGWMVSPLIEGMVGDVRLVGVEPLTAPGASLPMALQTGGDVGAFTSAQGQIFAGPDAVEDLAELRADIVVSAQIPPGVAYADIGVVQRLLDRASEVDILLMNPEQPFRQAGLAEIAPELSVRKGQAAADVGQLTGSFHLSLSAFGFLSFAVGIFIVHGAIGLAFEQRRPMMRTLRALGMPLGRLIGLIVVELFVFALAAGVIGVVLGYLIAAALLPGVAATLNGLYGAELGGALAWRPVWWVSGLGIAVGGTAIAGGGALHQLARMPLLASAHPRAMSMAAGRRARLQALAAFGLLMAAIVLGVLANTLYLGFATLGALLLGAALALPVIVDGILKLGRGFSKSALGQWFWADTRQQLPGLSLALMALLLAMAANVGVSTMVSSFRMTFLDFLDQRLASELYVATSTPEEAARLEAGMTDMGVAVLPIQWATETFGGVPTEVYGNRDHATYRDNWMFLESVSNPWNAVAAQEGVVINEQLYRRAGLSVGETIEIAGQPMTIVGVYGDYGNPIGQAVITEALFQSLYPSVTALRFGVRVPEEALPEVRSKIVEDLGIPNAQITNQARLKALSTDIFDRTFIVTDALNVLTLAVAGFAILMSLLTLASMRVPQLAPVWALGVTRRQLGVMDIGRAVLLATLTALVALPLGLALAWVLLSVVNVAAFGWKLPMLLFPSEYARLGVLALLAAVLASLWPAWRLSRTPPADLLKVFSHER